MTNNAVDSDGGGGRNMLRRATSAIRRSVVQCPAKKRM